MIIVIIVHKKTTPRVNCEPAKDLLIIDVRNHDIFKIITRPLIILSP